MALVTTEKMLKDAQAGHYAVGAFNVENLEFVMAVLAAAEETKSPVIMQTTPGTIKTAGLDYFYGMVKAAAERASVPVALHLDHGDGYDRCMQAFRTGYTSVMIDGSHETFEDNIALTKLVADARAAVDVPLVLHGTSGVPDEQVAEAVKNGICKVNYATELRQAFTKGFMAYMAENPTCFDPKKPGQAGMAEITKIVKIRMENLGSVGRA